MEKGKKQTTYFHPVIRNGWIIKFSVHENSDILLLMVSRYTGQTFIRYFIDEDRAIKFINMMIMKDPTEKLDIT